MPESRGRLLSHLGVLGGSQVAAQVLNMIALIVVARHLGSQGFGIVQLGAAVSAYALLLSEMGLMSLGIRDIAREDRGDTIAPYVRAHLSLLMQMALAGGLVMAVVLPTLPFFDQAPVVFILYAGLIVPQVFMMDWVTTGLQQMRWTGAFWVTRSALYAGGVVLLLPRLDGVAGLSNVTWVPVLYVAAFVLGDVLIVGHVARQLGSATVIPARPRWLETKQRLAAAAPIGGAMLVLRILLNADVLVLGFLASTRVVGVYAAASKLLLVLIVASNVAWKVLLPRLARTWTVSRSAFDREFQRLTAVVLAALVPLAVGGFWVGPDLVVFLYDATFADAGELFRVLAVAYPTLALGIFFGNSLIAMDAQQKYFPAVLLSAAAIVGLNVVWVPRYGGVGATWALLTASALLLVLTAWTVRAHLRISPIVLAWVAAGGIALSLTVRAVDSLHVLLRILAGAAAYVVVAGPALWRRLK